MDVKPDLELTEISPNRGPAAGGTLVTFTGNDFEMETNQTLFLFGKRQRPGVATPVGCSSKSQCTAIAPPGTGTVTVSVLTLVGGTVAGPQFIYVEGRTTPGLHVSRFGDFGRRVDPTRRAVPVRSIGAHEVQRRVRR